MAQFRRGGRTRPGRRVPDDRSVGERRPRCVRPPGPAQDLGLRLDVLEDRPRRGSTSRSSPGPSRPSRVVSADAIGTAPASEAAATSRSRVTAKASGRSPFRSTRAPTRRPSPKTSAAGPSHGARKPAVRRANAPASGWPEDRSADASGISASSAVSRPQPVATRSSSASSSDSESDPSGDRSGPEATRRWPADPAIPSGSAARPATWSRFVRTVLISPLWAIARNGWASRHSGWVFVA